MTGKEYHQFRILVDDLRKKSQWHIKEALMPENRNISADLNAKGWAFKEAAKALNDLLININQ